MATASVTPEAGVESRRGGRDSVAMTDDLSTLNNSLPPVFHYTRSLNSRWRTELLHHHKWLSMFTHDSKAYSSFYRTLRVFSSIMIVMTIQFSIYNYLIQDDNECEKLNTETECVKRISEYSGGQTKCAWSSNSAATATSNVTAAASAEDEVSWKCEYIQPDESVDQIVFVALWSLFCAQPLILLTQWLLTDILSLPTDRVMNFGEWVVHSWSGPRVRQLSAKEKRRQLITLQSMGYIDPDAPVSPSSANEATTTTTSGLRRRQTTAAANASTEQGNAEEEEEEEGGEEDEDNQTGGVGESASASVALAGGRETRSSKRAERLSLFGTRQKKPTDGSSGAAYGTVTQQFKNLTTQLKLFRSTLTEAQQMEFDALWGLTPDGAFIASRRLADSAVHWFSRLSVVDMIYLDIKRAQASVEREKMILEALVQYRDANKSSIRVLPSLSNNKVGVAELNRTHIASSSPDLESQLKVIETTENGNSSPIGLAMDRQLSRRLLQLFQIDLLPPLSALILQVKLQRDEPITIMNVRRVSLYTKIVGWSLLLLAYIGMLVFIGQFLLFNGQLRAISSRTLFAWAMSFVVWFLLDCLFVSSLLVLVVHVCIPVWILKDIAAVQKKILDNINSFHEVVQANNEKKLADIKASSITMNTAATVVVAAPPASNDNINNSITGVPHSVTASSSTRGRYARRQVVNYTPAQHLQAAAFNQQSQLVVGFQVYKFNAAEFICSAPRLARYFPRNRTAQAILHFSVPWARTSYLNGRLAESGYGYGYSALYGRSSVCSVLGTLLLTPLLPLPIWIQDLIVSMAIITCVNAVVWSCVIVKNESSFLWMLSIPLGVAILVIFLLYFVGRIVPTREVMTDLILTEMTPYVAPLDNEQLRELRLAHLRELEAAEAAAVAANPTPTAPRASSALYDSALTLLATEEQESEVSSSVALDVGAAPEIDSGSARNNAVVDAALSLLTIDENAKGAQSDSDCNCISTTGATLAADPSKATDMALALLLENEEENQDNQDNQDNQHTSTIDDSRSSAASRKEKKEKREKKEKQRKAKECDVEGRESNTTDDRKHKSKKDTKRRRSSKEKKRSTSDDSSGCQASDNVLPTTVDESHKKPGERNDGDCSDATVIDMQALMGECSGVDQRSDINRNQCDSDTEDIDAIMLGGSTVPPQPEAGIVLKADACVQDTALSLLMETEEAEEVEERERLRLLHCEKEEEEELERAKGVGGGEPEENRDADTDKSGQTKSFIVGVGTGTIASMSAAAAAAPAASDTVSVVETAVPIRVQVLLRENGDHTGPVSEISNIVVSETTFECVASVPAEARGDPSAAVSVKTYDHVEVAEKYTSSFSRKSVNELVPISRNTNRADQINDHDAGTGKESFSVSDNTLITVTPQDVPREKRKDEDENEEEEDADKGTPAVTAAAAATALREKEEQKELRKQKKQHQKSLVKAIVKGGDINSILKSSKKGLDRGVVAPVTAITAVAPVAPVTTHDRTTDTDTHHGHVAEGGAGDAGAAAAAAARSKEEKKKERKDLIKMLSKQTTNGVGTVDAAAAAAAPSPNKRNRQVSGSSISNSSSKKMTNRKNQHDNLRSSLVTTDAAPADVTDSSHSSSSMYRASLLVASNTRTAVARAQSISLLSASKVGKNSRRGTDDDDEDDDDDDDFTVSSVSSIDDDRSMFDSISDIDSDDYN